MEYYVFKKPGFKKRQSSKLKDASVRNWIAWSCDANNDSKIMALHAQRDHALLPIFLEILSNLDLETETWEVSKEHFDLWVKRTLGGSNRFDVLKRLKWLSNNGLIEFYCVSNDVLTDSYCTSNEFLNGVREGENPHHSTRDLEKRIEQKEETTTPIPPKVDSSCSSSENSLENCRYLELDIRGDGVREDEWIFRCLLEERRSKNLKTGVCNSLESFMTLYPSYLDRWRRWILKPLDVRIAAIVYTYLKSQADNPFKYALSMVENHSASLEEYRKRAQKYVEQNDLEVHIS